ncbi:MAG: hypothetical protein ACXVQJ_04205, partial [Actinomycetota bacterium]
MREREVDRLCLRCDWAGATKAKTCPRCGTTLYRPAPPRAEPRPAPERRWAHRVRRGGRHLRLRPRRRPIVPEWARGAAGIVAVMVVAVAAIVVIGRSPAPRPEGTSTSPSAAADTIPGLGGFLVYTAPAGAAFDRLWVWDLAGARVLEGPRVPRVLALVDPYRMTPDAWLGLTVQHGDGERALLMRSWGPSARPDAVATGDQVAWSPGGLNVAAASIGGKRSCGHLFVRTVLPGFSITRKDNARERPFCGSVRSVAWGSGGPFVDVLSGGSSSIFQLDPGLQRVSTNSILLGV